MKPYQEASNYLHTNLEAVCTYLFSEGKREGSNFVVGNISGQAGHSFSIALEPAQKRGLYKDFATGSAASHNLAKLWKIVRGIPEDNHARFFADLSAFSGVSFNWNNSQTAAGVAWPNWPHCLARFSEADAQRLAAHPKRGYQVETVRWLHAQGHLGLYRGQITFAMRSETGDVVGVHRWIESKGKLKFIKSPTLWVLGDPAVARILHVHESVWDLIAMIDRTDWHFDPATLCFCTRGAGNAKLVRGRVPVQIEKIYLWAQRDPPDAKTGISPNEVWQAKVVAVACGRPVHVVAIPESSNCKDLNDWTLLGATREQIIGACDFATLYKGQTREAKPPGPDFQSTPQEFPPSNERPCFRVHFSDLTINDRLYKAGLYSHDVVESGDKEYPRDIWICSPIAVIAKTATSKNRNYGRLLEYQSSNGIKRYWAMPMELLAGDGTPVLARLLDDGVEISHANRKKVLEYLSAETPAEFRRCAVRTGWYSETTFVLTDEIITAKNSQATDKVWFQAAAKTAEYLRGGNKENWSKNVATFASGNNYLIFAISFGLSGPLLFHLGLRGIGVHFYGDSTTGKTTTVEIAASCWGHGHDFLQTWNLTANGMEGVCVEHTDTLLALDEIKEIDARDLDRVAYSVVNGQGKIRSDRSGQSRAPHAWRVALLSTGEYSIRARLAEAGISIKTGQELRLVDVPVTGEKFGIFGKLHGAASGAEFSNKLRAAAQKDYGHAGPLQVEAILAYTTEQLHERHEKILACFSTANAQERRVAETFAAVALAGEIAARNRIVPWVIATSDDFSDSDSVNAAVVLFNRWKESRNTIPGVSSEHSNILRVINDCTERHGDSRFSDLHATASVSPTGYPIPSPSIRDRLGYFEDVGGQRIYLFTGDGLREATKGYDLTRVIKALDDAGAFAQTGYGSEKAKKRRTGDGKQVKLYHINPEKLQ